MRVLARPGLIRDKSFFICIGLILLRYLITDRRYGHGDFGVSLIR
jgi:hypothetical protein